MTWDDLIRAFGDGVNRRRDRPIHASDVNHGLGNRVNTRGERAIDASDLQSRADSRR